MYVADATSEAVASTPVKVTTDRYGFLIPNEGTPGASTSASDSSPAMSKEVTRIKKWQKMLGTTVPCGFCWQFSDPVRPSVNYIMH